MTFKVCFMEEALADMERLDEFVVAGEDGDWATAERALEAIRNGGFVGEFTLQLQKNRACNTFVRELIIAFGGSGYVALFEIDDAKTVTVLAVRHQREDDYH